MIGLRLATLLLLSTLAYLDFSLVALRLSDVLSLSNPVMLVFVALFFVSGPASWIVALGLRGGVSKLVSAYLLIGPLVILYDAVLASVLSARLEPREIQILSIPVGLTIALIGLFELMVDPMVKDRLENAYRVYLSPLLPYTLIMMPVVAATFTLLARTPFEATLGMLLYAAGLLVYQRVCNPRLTVYTIAGVAASAALYALLARLMNIGGWRAAVGLVIILALIPFSLRGGGSRVGGYTPLCPVTPLMAATLGVMGVVALEGVSIPTLLSNIEVYTVVGLIGWGVNTLFVSIASSPRRAAVLLEAIVKTPEVRIASGLALLLVGFETMGAPAQYATPLLVAGGVAAAVLNEGLGRSRVKTLRGVEARGG